MSTPLIDYVNLLHKYQDPGCREVRSFVEKHEDDETLMRRIGVFNRLWLMKEPEDC